MNCWQLLIIFVVSRAACQDTFDEFMTRPIDGVETNLAGITYCLALVDL
jgi:hypothetical protein